MPISSERSPSRPEAPDGSTATTTRFNEGTAPLLVGELTRGNLDAGHRLALAILGHDHLAVQRLQNGRWHALLAGASPARIAGLPFLEAAVTRRSSIADLVDHLPR